MAKNKKQKERKGSKSLLWAGLTLVLTISSMFALRNYSPLGTYTFSDCAREFGTNEGRRTSIHEPIKCVTDDGVEYQPVYSYDKQLKLYDDCVKKFNFSSIGPSGKWCQDLDAWIFRTQPHKEDKRWDRTVPSRSYKECEGSELDGAQPAIFPGPCVDPLTGRVFMPPENFEDLY